ncbi:hypothetical protein [Burkholderia dolosa]|uniref:hypothetical protein n=1 Tax=Burkholderia dolosa TaxID=152500 RepID=UPI0027D2F679|nr:hypothetical protein [Burkholderia dolosa]
MGSRIYLLVKIFEREEHADAFVEKGEMFCRTLGDFKKIEGDEARGDAYEGVTDWHQPDKISLVLSYKDKDGLDHSFPLKDLAGPVIMQNSGYDRLNLYCMYAVKIPDFEESYETEEERVRAVAKINAMLKVHSTLSDEMMAMGKFAVVIYRVGDFISKVKLAAREQGYASWNGSVQYFDPDTFHGSFKEIESVFRKRDAYSYQNEYRFVFGSHEPEGAKVIQVGALDGIAIKIPTNEFNEKFEMKLAE